MSITPYYERDGITIYHGDCVDVLRGLDEASIDAIVTDPPYGLEFMGKDWDKLTLSDPQAARWNGKRRPGKVDTRPAFKAGGARVSYGKDHVFLRCTKCGRRQFSGTPCKCDEPDWEAERPAGESYAAKMQRWHEAWAREAFRVLKPGGHLLAFGGTRTYHRMACAVEDAGFEIRDCLQWLYGSGFPKSHDVSKAIDKAAGAERVVVGIRRGAGMSARIPTGAGTFRDDAWTPRGPDLPATAPATPEAERWQGWGTSLKPANEPVVVAQKPRTYEGERDIIVASLSRLEAQLWSLLPASIAVESFGSSPSEYDAACAFARWSADEQHSTLDGLCAQTDTSRFVSVMATSLSTVQSWQRILGEHCDAMSTSTTATESSLTTDLRTLRSCLSAVTPRSIIQAAMTADGSSLSALPAARAFHALEAKSRSIRELSALASAIDNGRTSHPDAIVPASPANEPIVLARKPLSEPTVAANVLRWGTGALNVDATRVGTETLPAQRAGQARIGTFQRHDMVTPERSGRWPANVILSHSLFCTDDACADDCPVALLDAQSGERPAGAWPKGQIRRKGAGNVPFRSDSFNAERVVTSSGGASRYYKVCNWDARERSSTVQYVEETEAQPCGDESTGAGNTSAGKRTASSGGNSPTDGSGSKPTDVSLTDTKSTTSTTTRSTMTYRTSSSSPLDGTTTTTNDSARTTEPLRASSNDAASDAASTSRSQDSSGVQREPIKGTATSANGNTSKSGESATENATTPTCASTASAPSNSRFYYVAKASRKERGEGNNHPTVKPVDLMRYLVRLITPPGGTVLDPFGGSGTTALACLAEGFECVLIEREQDYAQIAESRIAQWAAN